MGVLTASKGSDAHHLSQKSSILGKADHDKVLENVCLIIQGAITDLDLLRTKIQVLISDLLFSLKTMNFSSSQVYSSAKWCVHLTPWLQQISMITYFFLKWFTLVSHF